MIPLTSYDILGPLLEILKERVTYIVTSTECPPDLRAQLDTVIYASTRLEFEELYKLRDLIMRKYGMAYITKAERNADKFRRAVHHGKREKRGKQCSSSNMQCNSVYAGC